MRIEGADYCNTCHVWVRECECESVGDLIVVRLPVSGLAQVIADELRAIIAEAPWRSSTQRDDPERWAALIAAAVRDRLDMRVPGETE